MSHTAEYPGAMMLLCSRMTTCASNVRPVLQVLLGSHKTNPEDISSSSIPLSLILTFSPGPTQETSSSSDHSWSTTTMDLFGRTIKVCPFLASPASTLPMTTVPMSLYLSAIGIINGRSINRTMGGSSSINGMNGSPLYQGHNCGSTDSLSPAPVKPEQGIKFRSF